VIVELAAIAGTTLVGVIAFASRIVRLQNEHERAMEPKPRLKPEAIAEKRRILEREREGLINVIKDPSTTTEIRFVNNNRLNSIRDALLAIADEDREDS
jgi:hypothetical protein